MHFKVYVHTPTLLFFFFFNRCFRNHEHGYTVYQYLLTEWPEINLSAGSLCVMPSAHTMALYQNEQKGKYCKKHFRVYFHGSEESFKNCMFYFTVCEHFGACIIAGHGTFQSVYFTFDVGP